MRIKNLPAIESMDGSQDALVIEQTDGSEDKSRKVSPAQIKQYVLNDMDEVPTQGSDNPVKSGGIFSTMAVPKYDATNRREYFEGGAAFDGNIDSTPTAGSNNAVASGGTKTYVDNAVSQLNAEIDAIDAAKADTYISPTRDTAQSFNVGTSTANRMFLLSTGYASVHQFGIIFINYSGTSIIYKSIASASLTVDAITYNNGIISITFSATPYTNARLIRLC